MDREDIYKEYEEAMAELKSRKEFLDAFTKAGDTFYIELASIMYDEAKEKVLNYERKLGY